ncbi:MAG: hypothetical protein BGO98_04420 [Myxococcales bacterium 68-20]|nr:CAP domain-containing protein [Myxococcales bacterium]OJY20541.1 MAG: hypothetical protein BGO98_04420 [Myxococcales bacterium 68-20]
MKLRAIATTALLLGGCVVESGNLPAPSATGRAADTTTDVRSSGDAGAEAPFDDAVCLEEAGQSRREQVCHRWRCDGRDAVAPARWSGDASSCLAGELDADAGERAVRLVNLHRFIAGVAPVGFEPSWTGAAQECALVAHANARLSHTPSRDWRCWSEVAAHASSISLVANRSAPLAIAAFIEDPGNESTMVHRRWLLSEELTAIGIGSTDRYACVVVDGRSLGAGDVTKTRRSSDAPPRGWGAWPPPGPVPIDVFATERLDEIGWTVQSSSDGLEQATVTVSSSGERLAVRATPLTPSLGSRSAIRFVPDGWKTEAGRSYVVSIQGPNTIDFTVEPTECP